MTETPEHGPLLRRVLSELEESDVAVCEDVEATPTSGIDLLLLVLSNAANHAKLCAASPP